jgi:hypothetical protein
MPARPRLAWPALSLASLVRITHLTGGRVDTPPVPDDRALGFLF